MSELKEHIAQSIASARDLYIRDLEAMTEEQLSFNPGGAARTGFDVTYEVVFVNRRIARRIRGEAVEPYNRQGWITAPGEFCLKHKAVEELRSSTDEVLSAWNALAADRMRDKIQTGPDSSTTALDLADLCAIHLTYHGAQLNYVQAILGDESVHW